MTGHADALADRWIPADPWESTVVTLLPGRRLSAASEFVVSQHLEGCLEFLAETAAIEPLVLLLADLAPPVIAQYFTPEHVVVVDIPGVCADGNGASWPRLLGVLLHETAHAMAPRTWHGPHDDAYARAASALGWRLGIDGCTASDRLDARWSAACWPLGGWHDEALSKVPWPALSIVSR